MPKNTANLGAITPTQSVIKLDKINQRLLSLLSANARAQYSELSRKLKISKSNVMRRISILEDKGILTGYHAFIDVTKLNLGAALLMIQTKCTEEQKEEYIKMIYTTKTVYALVELTGKYDILVAFYYKDEKQKDKTIETIVVPSYVKDFIASKIITYFPRLDYTSDIFKTTEKFESKLIASKTKTEFDKLDLNLLLQLSQNCRQSFITISKKLGISRETVKYRVKKLLSNKIIAKFQPTINLFSLGFESYFLTLKLSKPTQKDKIINYLKSTYRCNTILKTNWDLIALIHFKSHKEFRIFENDMTSKFKDAIYEYSFELAKQQHKLDWFPEEIVKMI